MAEILAPLATAVGSAVVNKVVNGLSQPSRKNKKQAKPAPSARKNPRAQKKKQPKAPKAAPPQVVVSEQSARLHQVKAVPAMYGNVVRNDVKRSKNKDPLTKHFRGSDCFVGQEDLGSVMASSVPEIGENLLVLTLNPRLLSNTKLKLYSQLYQRYRFKRISLSFINNQGSAASGLIAFAVQDSMVARIPPSGDDGIRQMMSISGAEQCNVGMPFLLHHEFKVPTQPYYLIADDGNDISSTLVNQARIIIKACSPFTANQFLGRLELHYEVQFYDEALSTAQNIYQYSGDVTMFSNVSVSGLSPPYPLGILSPTGVQKPFPINYAAYNFYVIVFKESATITFAGSSNYVEAGTEWYGLQTQGDININRIAPSKDELIAGSYLGSTSSAGTVDVKVQISQTGKYVSDALAMHMKQDLDLEKEPRVLIPLRVPLRYARVIAKAMSSVEESDKIDLGFTIVAWANERIDEKSRIVSPSLKWMIKSLLNEDDDEKEDESLVSENELC